MSLPTKLAITGVGVAVLMLLAFLTPAPAMAQIASCTHRRIGQHSVRPDSAREELLIAFSGTTSAVIGGDSSVHGAGNEARFPPAPLREPSGASRTGFGLGPAETPPLRPVLSHQRGAVRGPYGLAVRRG
jgi:hypothetical protein